MTGEPVRVIAAGHKVTCGQYPTSASEPTASAPDNLGLALQTRKGSAAAPVADPRRSQLISHQPHQLPAVRSSAISRHHRVPLRAQNR
jgi:hypothetical protein